MRWGTITKLEITKFLSLISFPVDLPSDVQKTVSETLGPIRGGDS